MAEATPAEEVPVQHRKILLPVDDTDEAERAVFWAAEHMHRGVPPLPPPPLRHIRTHRQHVSAGSRRGDRRGRVRAAARGEHLGGLRRRGGDDVRAPPSRSCSPHAPAGDPLGYSAAGTEMWLVYVADLPTGGAGTGVSAKVC
mmetsp:Transcript_23579/g.80369  ORF Transcript_23579/g.80369 Transcript_23579/m.80369 type:complete len:143 (-) Transcript_23579:699-1127(-)